MSAVQLLQAEALFSPLIFKARGCYHAGQPRELRISPPAVPAERPLKVSHPWSVTSVGSVWAVSQFVAQPRAFSRGTTRMAALAADGPSLAPLSGKSPKGAPAQGKQLPPVEELKAVLFDVDGTLAHSDPMHFLAFREILLEVDFQEGRPIDEQFFRQHISGRHNPDIGVDLFPHWTAERRDALLAEKEARFRKMAAVQLQEVSGLSRFCKWIEDHGVRCAAVTNAPRENAEQMIAALGLSSFFEHLVVGSECIRAKPFPEPYLVALEKLGVSAANACAVEDSPSGMRAAVAAGLPTIGVLTGQEAPVLEAVGAAFTIVDFNDPLLWQKLEPTS